MSLTSSTSRRRRQSRVQQYDTSSDEEASDGAEGAENTDEDEDDEAPTAAHPLPQPSPITANTSSPRRPPARPLKDTTTQTRKSRPSRGISSSRSGGGGSSVPSYEDSYFPPMTKLLSNNNYLQQEQQRPYPTTARTTRRPHRPRTNTLPPSLDRSTTTISTDYSSSSTSGPFWQPLKPSTTRNKTNNIPLKRSKTVREPAGAPVQAVVPRAPRNVAAARIQEVGDEDADLDEDDYEVGESGALPLVGPPAPRKLVAGGKKAALAVELKLNLEIELEIKAFIHGDVMLELFN